MIITINYNVIIFIIYKKGKVGQECNFGGIFELDKYLDKYTQLDKNIKFGQQKLYLDIDYSRKLQAGQIYKEEQIFLIWTRF